MTLQRAYLFARDVLEELPSVWWIARSRDCCRTGGHRWSFSRPTMIGLGMELECARCGTSWSPGAVDGWITIYPNTTNSTARVSR